MEDLEVGADLGLRFVRALAAKDRVALSDVLDPQVEFRGLTPSSGWEASTPDGVCEILFGSWFEPLDHIQDVLEVESIPFADRDRLHYRLRVEREGADYLVEQHGYYDVADGRIARMHLMCSGFRAWPD